MKVSRRCKDQRLAVPGMTQTMALQTDDLPTRACHLMTTGCDDRIVLDGVTGLNRYNTAPQPTTGIAYSSSTANAISRGAFAAVCRRLAQLAPDGPMPPSVYGAALEDIRVRLRATYQLPRAVEIIFAASGTDLEYVSLAMAHRAGCDGIDNILLGIDEVGSGCIHSASGRHFAAVTPLGHAVESGQPLAPETAAMIRLIDVPIRGAGGFADESEDVLLAIAAAAEAAIAANRHPLIHVVHGSKTGLVVPSCAHIDALRRRFGDRVSFVVDACQARISKEMVAAYLARGCILFLTGSKFIGGPPFSGMALVPEALLRRSAGLLPGMERIFARWEWPMDWPPAQSLSNIANPGLLLRLEASLYELELYHGLAPAELRRTVDLFNRAVDGLTHRLGASRILPHGQKAEDNFALQPVELRTLVTLDLSHMDGRLDFDFARRLHRALSCTGKRDGVPQLFPIRLGQPVKCLPLGHGRFGACLRIGLSMPQMVEFSMLDTAALSRKLEDDMAMIGNRIERFVRAEQ